MAKIQVNFAQIFITSLLIISIAGLIVFKRLSCEFHLPAYKMLYHIFHYGCLQLLMFVVSPALAFAILFDRNRFSIDWIVIQTAHSELLHAVMFFLNLIPSLTALKVGYPQIYIPVSIFFSLLNIPYMMIQRFNRPRFIMLMERNRKKGNSQV